MDIGLIRRAREHALPEAIQPRHLVLAALECDASIAPDLRSSGIDPAAVAAGAADPAPWDASDELAIARQLERSLQQYGPDAEARSRVFRGMREQILAAGFPPDDPRLAIDPEEFITQTFRECARWSLVGDRLRDPVATAGTTLLVGRVRQRLDKARLRAGDASAGDRLHARAVVACLLPVALAYSGGCSFRRAAEAMFGPAADAFVEGRRGASPGLPLFEETQIERERRRMPRHLLVSALRTIAEAGGSTAYRVADWDDLRRRLGYQATVQPDPGEVWGITHSAAEVMEVMARAAEVATSRHAAGCDIELQRAVAVVLALHRDERTRDLVTDSGAPVAEFAALRCACDDRGSADAPSGGGAGDGDEARPPRSFSVLWQSEAAGERASVLQPRHFVVAALRCLPEFTSELARPGALDRLRAALRTAIPDAAAAPNLSPPMLTEPVAQALQRHSALDDFAWWPGMSSFAGETASAAICLEFVLRDRALRDAMQGCGFDEERVRSAIDVCSRGFAWID